MKLYPFYTLKAPWDSQGKIKMYYGMSRVKKQLSGKRSIIKIIRQNYWKSSVYDHFDFILQDDFNCRLLKKFYINN